MTAVHDTIWWPDPQEQAGYQSAGTADPAPTPGWARGPPSEPALVPSWTRAAGPLSGKAREAVASPGTQTPVLSKHFAPVLGRFLDFSEQNGGCVWGQGLGSCLGTRLEGAQGCPSQGSPAACSCVCGHGTWHSPGWPLLHRRCTEPGTGVCSEDRVPLHPDSLSPASAWPTPGAPPGPSLLTAQPRARAWDGTRGQVSAAARLTRWGHRGRRSRVT